MATSWRESYRRYTQFFLNIVNLYKKRADLRAFLEVILSISTVTIFLLFALKPTVITIIGLVQEIQEKKAMVDTLNKKIGDLQTASTVFAQNKSAVDDVENAVPTAAAPAEVAKQIQGLATRDSVSIQGISVGQLTLIGQDTARKRRSDNKPLPENAKEMTFNISAIGPYSQLLSFVKDFGNLRLISKIDTLGVNSSKTESGQIIVAVLSGRFPFIGTQ